MNSEKNEDIFHFDDDGEDYDFVLPPEYKISQDRPHQESASGDESHGPVDAEGVQGRRVSFDTGRNEYYYVERCSDADEELGTKEFEIEIPLEQELDKSRVDMQGAEEDELEEELIDRTGTLADASVQSRKPFLETLPSVREDGVPDSILGENLLCLTMDKEAGKTEENQPGSSFVEMASDNSLLSNDGCSFCPRDGQVVRESLPSIKDNPFILRDRMNLK